ncbi:MAG: hypothetical protein F6K56_23415 [Moorea sp. SIO3G5]|nr:hypothetical protein [Moorena sp. SIO3G5]
MYLTELQTAVVPFEFTRLPNNHIQAMLTNKIILRYQRFFVAFVLLLLIETSSFFCPSAWAWDSADWKNPTHPTHSYLTEWGIDQLKGQYPELQQFRNAIIDGANTELHELPVSGIEYGIDLNAKRIEHKGTNEGCDDIEGWWQDSLTAYDQNRKSQAYFLLGIMLHMIEDMGVPAHANLVYHQGNLTEFDNFEFMALSNWKPKFDDINRQDPRYSEPYKYYYLSKEWTHVDAPNYNDPDSFSKTWFFASSTERKLLSNRQGRTSYLVKWALNSAVKAYLS